MTLLCLCEGRRDRRGGGEAGGRQLQVLAVPRALRQAGRDPEQGEDRGHRGERAEGGRPAHGAGRGGRGLLHRAARPQRPAPALHLRRVRRLLLARRQHGRRRHTGRVSLLFFSPDQVNLN